MVPIRPAVAAASALLAIGGAAPTPTRAATHHRSSGARLVVGYRTGADLRRALRETRASVLLRVAPLRVAEVRVEAPSTANALRRVNGIRFVARPSMRRPLADPALATGVTAATGGLEWQYAATGESAVPSFVLRAAAGVTIAIVDTGADLTAPDLAAKQPAAYNVRTGGADVPDTIGHGTFVASLAAGSTTNGEGIAGFGGEARLLVIKATRPDGSMTDVDEAAAIVYAVDHGARVINLSLAGVTTSETERRAIGYAAAHDVLVVAAVGNEQRTGNPVEYPAALLQPVGSRGVGGSGLAVAASTASGAHAPFSNTGSWISLAAPGQHVFGDVSELSSPAAFPRTPLPGSHAGLYGYASGTSFAAPQVAGAAALVWAADPALTAPGVAAILKATASGHGRWTPGLGYGVVDVALAVERALEDAAARAGAAPEVSAALPR